MKEIHMSQSFAEDHYTALDIVKTELNDDVNHPPHYNQYGIECIDGIRASMTDLEFRGYLKGNVQKYLWRYNYKSKPLQDLQKAEWYLKRLISEIENA
jgi:hypothetical protein